MSNRNLIGELLTLALIACLGLIVWSNERRTDHQEAELTIYSRRLDRLEAATNLLYQWSPYKAHATAQFDHIDRTNKP